MYRLFGFPTQNSMKPLYVLHQLGVDFEFCLVDLARRENRSDWFRKMTPVGKVPVLEHDGEFLFESGAICRYVANVENSPLYPEHKLERARVDQWMDYFTCHPGRWLSSLYFQKIMKPRVGLGEPDPAQCAEAEDFARQQLGAVNAWLEHNDYLANGRLSIADLFAFAYVEQAGAIEFPLDDYPRVQSWFSGLEALPAIARAREQVKR